MMTPRELHWRNWVDATRALDYLERCCGEGRPVVRHALIAIRERSKYVLDALEREAELLAGGNEI